MHFNESVHDAGNMTPEDRFVAQCDLLQQMAEGMIDDRQQSLRSHLAEILRQVERMESAARTINRSLPVWTDEYISRIRRALEHPENFATKGFIGVFASTSLSRSDSSKS